mmetsp:Transcript_24962/g.42660  ORF Transcript_24962/g.42660 Transcript_24962/m.42660 type:complete len:179 (+) Transcript_24962:35-571(+)
MVRGVGWAADMCMCSRLRAYMRVRVRVRVRVRMCACAPRFRMPAATALLRALWSLRKHRRVGCLLTAPRLRDRLRQWRHASSAALSVQQIEHLVELQVRADASHRAFGLRRACPVHDGRAALLGNAGGAVGGRQADRVCPRHASLVLVGTMQRRGSRVERGAEELDIGGRGLEALHRS